MFLRFFYDRLISFIFTFYIPSLSGATSPIFLVVKDAREKPIFALPSFCLSPCVLYREIPHEGKMRVEAVLEIPHEGKRGLLPDGLDHFMPLSAYDKDYTNNVEYGKNTLYGLKC